MRQLLMVTAIVVFGWFAGFVIRAQEDTSTPVIYGDMLVDPLVIESQLLWQRTAPGDSNVGGQHGWLRKFLGWDFGVMVYGFDPNIDQSQREMFRQACGVWEQNTPVRCVERTTQFGYVRIATGPGNPNAPSGCYAYLGQWQRLNPTEIHLDKGCWVMFAIIHEIGHALNFVHTHQRPDRDDYVRVDWDAIASNAKYAFDVLPINKPTVPYGFMSVMHYTAFAFSNTDGRPTLIPQPGYEQFAQIMGTGQSATEDDLQAVRNYYATVLGPMERMNPVQSPRRDFDPGDLLDATERLQTFLVSKIGFKRPLGLLLPDGRVNLRAISDWILGVYLPARSAGYSVEQAFGITVSRLTALREWQDIHPDEQPLRFSGEVRPLVSVDVAEFHGFLEWLDDVYVVELGRPLGLVSNGGPDLNGIAVWTFDVYLQERLRGISPEGARTVVLNRIQETADWRGKH